MDVKRGLVLLLIVSGFALTGCGNNPHSAATHGDKAFAAAPAELKNVWQKAASAVQADDYVGAITNLEMLAMSTNLTPDQAQAVKQTSASVSDAMYAAANKGDAKATQAIEALRKLRSR